MQDLLADLYLFTKTAHVVSVIAWMAGLLYLPRLFVYHAEGWNHGGVTPGSEMDLIFRRQERLLFRAIMNPAMIATWVFGLLLVLTPQAGVDPGSTWVWSKAAGVVGLTWFHHWLGRRRADFAGGTNRHSGRLYRVVNEVPTVLMVVVVASVIVKF
ncbi:MAG: CopD family protein [Paracoccaceae bacterium]